MKKPTRASNHEDPPPLGRSWRVLYAAVLLNLVLLILVFYGFTRAFS
jgi:hypothetical protein